MHYGWIIVAACLVVGMCGYDTCFSFTLFYEHLAAEFGWSRAAISGAMSVGLIAYGICGFPMGWCADRFGPRPTVVAGGLIFGLGTALDYMMALGMGHIAAHEADLRDYAQERLSGINWLNVQGNAPGKGAIFSFTMEGAAHAHDISTILDQKGVAVRAGHHCAQPLMQHLGVTATCRASFAMYNTRDEVDKLVEALELCHELLS